MVKNLKKPDPVGRQMPPFYTTYMHLFSCVFSKNNTNKKTHEKETKKTKFHT